MTPFCGVDGRECTVADVAEDGYVERTCCGGDGKGGEKEEKEKERKEIGEK
jgi:hypothetical protein